MAKPKTGLIDNSEIHLRKLVTDNGTTYWLVASCGKGISPVTVKVIESQFKYMRKTYGLKVYVESLKEPSASVKAGIATRKANREAKMAKSAQDYADLSAAIMGVRKPKTTKEQRIQAIVDDHKIIARAAKRAGEEGNKKFFAKLGVKYKTKG